jgi:hypothetical protein
MTKAVLASPPKISIGLLCLGLMGLVAGCRTHGTSAGSAPPTDWLKSWRAQNTVWRGIHLGVSNDDAAKALIEALPKLASLGVNVVVAEVNYGFEFQSHPELRPSRFLTRARAREIVDTAHEQGIRVIPQLNCLGHQSWSKTTGPLLAHYPQFDETPGQYPGNTNIYCRSWCPQNPDVNPVVFALIDELVEAFQADAFHVGMDEVFLIASEYCPRCRGGDPAKLFAKAVNDLHKHVAGKHKLEMLMWGDRLLDAKAMGYSEWEAAKNGTSGAADLIPKDIIMCDWHYAKQPAYPSVPALLAKGFRVWPSGWQPLDASLAFSDYSRQQKNPRLIGYLCTTWGRVKISEMAQWPPVNEVLLQWK